MRPLFEDVLVILSYVQLILFVLFAYPAVLLARKQAGHQPYFHMYSKASLCTSLLFDYQIKSVPVIKFVSMSMYIFLQSQAATCHSE